MRWRDFVSGRLFTYGFSGKVQFPGNPGRKRFVASLVERNNRSKFDLKMVGFGFLARGFGYYVPMSTLALLAYLARRRRQSLWFLQALAQGAALCGHAHLSRSIGLGNHPVIAERVLAAICGSAAR